MWSGTGAPERCDYHIVWTPKYRFRVLTGLVKDLVEHDIRMLSEWKGCEVIELNVQADHVHLVISIPPKVSVSTLMAVRRCGILKGKLAIKLFKSYPQLKKKPYWGNHRSGAPVLGTGLFCQYGGHQ